MCVKQSIKRAGVFAGISLAVLLAGCSSHRNPLKAATPMVAATFLVKASVAAEKKLKLFSGSGGGYYYGECMNGKAKKLLCNQLYNAMVDYAKTVESFKGVTINDLKNQTVFNSLKEDYKRVQFNNI